jgi:hypothetical protein
MAANDGGQCDLVSQQESVRSRGVAKREDVTLGP